MKRTCLKCNTEQEMTKTIVCEGTSKECFCWWCPKCKDQIADSATQNINKASLCQGKAAQNEIRADLGGKDGD